MSESRTAPAPEVGEGDVLPLTVGAPAHGGHCVARFGPPPGRVVFVRHALPGEEVLAEVTEVQRGFLRADAVRVLTPSPDRVPAPCRFAHPGGCGGCDLQHASRDAQLRWKTAVVRELLARLGGVGADDLDALDPRVEALPGDADGLGWRTRVRYAVAASGRAGLRVHRSHQVVAVDRCVIAHPAVQDCDVLDRDWPRTDAVSVVVGAEDDRTVLADGAVLTGPGEVVERAGGRRWRLPATAFWQVHPAAAETLGSAVAGLLAPRPGDRIWDLYGGAGLFAAALADAAGGPVDLTIVESAPDGVAAARRNLADLADLRVVADRVEPVLRRHRLPAGVDLVVLDPPRSGAGRQVVRAVAASGARAVAYVACDPAGLARDVRTFAEAGWRLAAVRAYDCFPMTQHVECVALLLPAGRDPA
ncbi:23S rRNA methyltransferase [Pilimelia terevasa]|uniref:23S rRNA methyltransferase n=1 Tax=Pilimelia terevasa TaxID=53372 RepID=A0A8J3FL75_9ACTN|nr:TRAM domain-containing protein [Pilimelia terevasa]GGK38879.1 23S rRNA methyltransferase [Pilimelia terevasa]